MRERFLRFMQGRYGIDKFSNFLIVLALVFLVLETFAGRSMLRVVFNIIAVLLVIYAYTRILSKNHYKRYAENERYMKWHNKVKFFITRKKSHMEQRKTHHIYKCPQCRQSIRVPRGKGRIAITCPKCGNEFIKRS